MNPQLQENSFLGRGWSFPPTFDRFSRGVETVQGDEDIDQSIRLILGTAPGERQMLPKFGCDLSRYAFRVLDSSMMMLIEKQVRSALLNFEPRIDVNEVTVSTDSVQNGRILVAIDYTVRSVNRRHNLVFPYYLGEATGVPG